MDILIVAAVSVLAFVLEDFVSAQGWISVGPEARGVSSVLAAAVAAVSLVWFRGGTLADLGFRRPERWAIVPLQVVGILVAFLAAQSLAPVLVSPFFSLPEPDLSKYDAIVGNLGAAIGLVLILPLTASIPEELIYRGFLMGRLSDIFGWDRRGAVLTVLVQALIFGSIHFQWGVGGMVVTAIMGAVWGTAYLLCGRNLWVVILAHSGGHVLLGIQLYLGESIVL
jgi:membrane protease YdiL (CAAX protease family)